MNVFVLCTGRCGSTTFVQACRHIRNYSCAHESRCRWTGSARLAYPPDHIEVDNRLSWLLGRLDRAYGNGAFYVHLIRDRQAVAESFLKRWGRGIIGAYARDVLMGGRGSAEPIEVCLDYWDTVNANIELFLRDKTQKLIFPLEEAGAVFPVFWQAIQAEGNQQAAMEEWNRFYNASSDETEL